MAQQQIPEDSLFHCRIVYEDSIYAPLRGRQELEENVGIYLDDNYEQISIPVPHFGGSDPADIIHDFQRVGPPPNPRPAPRPPNPRRLVDAVVTPAYPVLTALNDGSRASQLITTSLWTNATSPSSTPPR